MIIGAENHKYTKTNDPYGIKKLVNQQKGTIEPDEDTISFAEEVKAYTDRTFTGMSDEDWEELKSLCKKYLEENPIESDGDLQRYNSFVKKLLLDYGYKGDLEMAVASLISGSESDSGKTEDVGADGEKLSKGNVTKQSVVEEDGSKYLLIEINHKKNFKIKIADESILKEKSSEDTQSNEKMRNKTNIESALVNRLQKGLDAYGNSFLYMSDAI